MRRYFVVGLFLMLFLYGCIIQKPSENVTSNETLPPTQFLGCGAIKDPVEGDKCYYEDAEKNNSLVKCSFILSDSLRDKCVYKFAIDRNDSALCDTIVDRVKEDECYFNVAPSAGLATCNKIINESYKKQCYSKLGNYSIFCQGLVNYSYTFCIAMASNNPKECNAIENLTLVDQCYFDFAKNKTSYQSCVWIKSLGVKDSCYEFVALKTKNQSLCEMINFSYSKQLCSARIIGTESYCENLTDYLQRDACFKTFAVENLNEIKCDIIKTDLYRDMCLQEIATAKGDAAICSRITCYACIKDKDDCYKGVAASTKLVAPCDLVSEPLTRDLCRLETAKLSMNASQCSTIENNYRRDSCYSIVINYYSYDPTTCEGIVPQEWMDECYNRAAIVTGNSTLCSKIKDALVKGNCIIGTS